MTQKPRKAIIAVFGFKLPQIHNEFDEMTQPKPHSIALSELKAPKPVGLYPHAKRVGDYLWLSGIGPREPGSNRIPGNEYAADGSLTAYDFAQQCHSVFANVKAVLEGSGANWDQLIDVTVYLTDMQRDFAVYNQIWAEHFTANGPCRTTLGISALPTPIAIELKCVAYLAQ